jgi:DNA-binding response OmpR family regulator
VTSAILALEKDLFFSVKIRDTLQHHGWMVTTARTLSAFEQRLLAERDEKPAMVIINISTKGVDWEKAIRLARAQGLPVLAFGSHMDLEARTKALAAGAQKVVANSKFTRDMVTLVQRLLEPSAVTTTGVEEQNKEDKSEAGPA